MAEAGAAGDGQASALFHRASTRHAVGSRRRSVMTGTAKTRFEARRSFPIVALVLTVAGLLTWMGWKATRPDLTEHS
jgi:hypothetical protein